MVGVSQSGGLEKNRRKNCHEDRVDSDNHTRHVTQGQTAVCVLAQKT